jgi:hypothetical protein
MPYIKDRYVIDYQMENLLAHVRANQGAITPGELNYMITRLLIEYLPENKADISYTELNCVVGVLECAKQELYRRVVVPHENFKRGQNGDVYPT